MLRLLWISVVMVSAVGCLSPVEQRSLGVVDHADGGVDTDAGSPDAGPGDAGLDAGAAVDAGHSTDAGSALVASLAPLPPSACSNTAPPQCPGAGSCLMIFRAGQAAARVALPPPSAGTIVYATHSGDAVFTVTEASDASRVWQSRVGHAPVEVSSSDAGVISLDSVSSRESSSGFQSAFVLSTGPSMGHRVATQLAPDAQAISLGPVGGANSTLTSNTFAWEDTMFVGMSDGLHRVDLDGDTTIHTVSSISGTPETIRSLDVQAGASEYTAFFAQCTATGECSLLSKARLQTGATLIGALPSVGWRGASIAIAGSFVYALGPTALVRFPLTGGPAQLVYAGAELPQFVGTLSSEQLRVVNGKLYFGAVCQVFPDPDSPKYGTVELDPDTRIARWLNLDPDYPAVPFVASLGYTTTGEGALWATPAGTYLLQP